MAEKEVKSDEILSRLPSSSLVPEKADIKWRDEAIAESRKTLNLEDEENKSIIALRDIWGIWVLVFIGVIVAFDMLLVWKYGRGEWVFEDSTVVFVVITENFLKIIGLGLVIATQTFEKIFKNSPRKS